jgi:uncharacterized membrane protein YeaQ/YmgE (transglycosylase-associated protein family)
MLVFGSITLTLNDVALWILAGAVIGVIVGQLMRTKGFGVFGDLLFGAIGAALANFIANFFLNMGQYGFLGRLIVAAIGSIILTVLARLATFRRGRAEVVE